MKSKTTTPVHHCNECQFASVDTNYINRDVEGRFFMLRCQFQQFKRFFHDPVCERFVERTTHLTKIKHL